MSTPAEESGSRREVIAENAIRLIARDGVRSLTHRAVDREAQIPAGSTSYYAKTRRALIELIVERLAARSSADAQALAQMLGAATATRQIFGVGELSGLVAQLIERLSARTEDMRARYALLLELDDEPALRAKLTDRSQVHNLAKQVSAEGLSGAGLPVSDARVDELIALADALVFQRVVVDASTPVEAILTAYLTGIVDVD
ncbi:TetR family transcriptional regulator [Gordonia sp. ABSL1-1]|uniref:TetR/AcrR family transcriptional regulator n=1 Tax=Gordonia sp. ABSL1-1 TaxID=3053923 RepID=UPI0025732D81|nr:TetR/AcrR family transcriptional regulator [Gordonia sp. ABSL1-1]MDL9936627.1 TetR family transcriptional regulator [Gordonia sp. ABSL1-1]